MEDDESDDEAEVLQKIALGLAITSNTLMIAIEKAKDKEEHSSKSARDVPTGSRKTSKYMKSLYKKLSTVDKNKPMWTSLADGHHINYRRSNSKQMSAARYSEEDCLAQGARVIYKDPNRRLLSAAKNGDNKTVEQCLTQGAWVDYKEVKTGWTSLHMASRYGYTDIVDLLLSHGADSYIKNNDGKTPYHYASNHIKELMRQKSKGKERFYKGNKEQFKQESSVPEQFLLRDQSTILNLLLGEGSYESYDMRIMVTGQFGVGKTSLVMILVGENVPDIRQSTNGISLLEGRCGLGIERRDWILMDKYDYNGLDVIYNKVLMSTEESQVNLKVAAAENHQQLLNSKSAKEDTANVVQSIPSDVDVLNQRHKDPSLKFGKIKAQMTNDKIRKKMVQVLQSGKYKMKVGRLMFWDFGGQYVYYTTHQTFLTYRALFLVVFDGSKGLKEEVNDVICFPGQHGVPTAAVFLQHWVNSILTYCKVIHPGIPKILFIATHKDKVPKENVEEIRSTLYYEIEDLFRYHEGRHHLVLDHRIFVNATDKNDSEINNLKQIITDLTFEHPCWGERMPNTWIPLELEIAELAAKGKQVLSLKEVEDLNNSSEISVLSENDLKFFLQFQHSLGKIVYFDTPQLREFVIISPIFMVEVMKSFVTDEQFWPKGDREQQTFKTMSRFGLIRKNDLFEIWNRPEFAKIMPHKEFVFDMLVHLDILSKQRRYDVITGRQLHVEDYFVPCMLTRTNTTSYIEKECIPNRAIGLAFVFKGTVIPPALPNRLISACLSMWSVKEYHNDKMLFSGFVVLSWDKSHDIVVCVKNDRILVYMIHRSSKGLIVSDIATGVRECMHIHLQRIFEFYQSTVSNETNDGKLPFSVELACSDLTCYVPEAAVLQDKTMLCSKHNGRYEIDVWYQDKNVDHCDVNCDGLSEDALCKTPDDIEILRFSSKFSAEKVQEIVIRLGIKKHDWDDTVLEYPRDMALVKFLMLVKWRNSMKGTFQQIADTLTKMEEMTHVLCQIRRMKRKSTDIPEEHLDSVPTDEILDALAPEIGTYSFRLGIQLGLSVPELQTIQYLCHNDLVAQTKQIFYTWRNDRTIKATLGVLHQALVNVERGALCLKYIIDKFGVKQHSFQE